MIKKPQCVLQQLVYSLAENQKKHVRAELWKDHISGSPSVKTEHNSGPVLPDFRSYRQFRCLQTDRYSILLSTGNNCILTTDATPVLVRNILTSNGIVLMCEKFSTVEDDFTYPLPSSKLGIYKVCGQTADLFAVPVSAFARKCLLLPLDVHTDTFVVFPLLH